MSYGSMYGNGPFGPYSYGYMNSFNSPFGMTGMNPFMMQNGFNNPFMMQNGFNNPFMMQNGFNNPFMMQNGFNNPFMMQNGFNNPFMMQNGFNNPFMMQNGFNNPFVPQFGLNNPFQMTPPFAVANPMNPFGLNPWNNPAAWGPRGVNPNFPR